LRGEKGAIGGKNGEGEEKRRTIIEKRRGEATNPPLRLLKGGIFQRTVL